MLFKAICRRRLLYNATHATAHKVSTGRTTHDGNSGIEGDGLGDKIGIGKCVSEGFWLGGVVTGLGVEAGVNVDTGEDVAGVEG